MESGGRNRSSCAGSKEMERVGDRWGKMGGYFGTSESTQWGVVPV